MSSPLPFEKSLSFESLRQPQPKPVSLPWLETKYVEEAYRILTSEQWLYKSKSPTVYSIAGKIDGKKSYCLSIAFPTDIKGAMLPEIENAKDKFQEIFLKGIRRWSPFIKTIKKISTFTRETTVGEFIGSILGQSVQSFFKI